VHVHYFFSQDFLLSIAPIEIFYEDFLKTSVDNRLRASYRTYWVIRHQKGETNLDLMMQETIGYQ